MIRDVLRDAVAFVDGELYAGEIEQVSLPELQIQTEEMRAGGLDAPIEIDMGMEAMRASLQFKSVPKEVMQLFGKGDIDVKIRGALVSHDGDTRGATARLRGRFVDHNPGDWQSGQQASFEATMACHFYELEIGGEQVHKIDVENMVRIVNGEDQLEGIREALGL